MPSTLCQAPGGRSSEENPHSEMTPSMSSSSSGLSLICGEFVVPEVDGRRLGRPGSAGSGARIVKAIGRPVDARGDERHRNEDAAPSFLTNR